MGIHWEGRGIKVAQRRPSPELTVQCAPKATRRQTTKTKSSHNQPLQKLLENEKLLNNVKFKGKALFKSEKYMIKTFAI
jgi:hypothetical protein